MAQFDAFPQPVPALRRTYPFAIELRSDLIALGEDTVIAPLVPRKRLAQMPGRLAPVVELDGEPYVVLIEKLTMIPVRGLPRRIANLSRYREPLLGAVDLLFFGV